MLRWVRFVFVAAVAASLSFGFWRLGYSVGTPYPIRLFNDHRRLFVETAAHVEDGTLPERGDNQGYQVPQALWEMGIRYIRRDEGCVAFVFATGPICPTDRILFSPHGHRGLPRYDLTCLFASAYIDENWHFIQTE